MSLRHCRSIVAFALLIMTVAVGVASADDCPTSVVFEPRADGTVDAGWTGLEHEMPIAGVTLHLSLSCPVSTTPCGTCTVAGLYPQLYPQRCRDDSSIPCTFATEVDDCGAAGTCATFLSPPQPLGTGGLPLCYTTEVKGPVTGSVDVETGEFSTQVPIGGEVRFGVSGAPLGGGAMQPCPRCVGDPVPNDGNRAGSCDAGARAGLTCDMHSISPYADFGAASFDCPADTSVFGTFDAGAITAATAPATRTLTAASPLCTASIIGATGVRCFCATCNNATADPCGDDADCPPSGGDPGICNGKRCLSGPNNGAPCTTGSECPAGLCSRPGEPTRPHACLDDSVTPNGPADDCSPTGECVNGPVSEYCTNHPDRVCNDDDDCDNLPGACQAQLRPCFTDNGVLGATISVGGSSTPPVGGIAEPTDLGALACVRPTVASLLNAVGGFPGLVRTHQPGRLRFGDVSGPIPTAVPSPTPTSTPFLGPACTSAPDACRASVVTGKSKLQILDKDWDVKDKLTWQWNVGAATTLAELGDPTTTTEYALCLYDFTGLRAEMRIPAGGLCNGKPCWRAQTRGFTYRHSAGSSGGITNLQLRSGADGKAQMKAKGAGIALPLPNLGTLHDALHVQLRNRENGLCFDTTFVPPFDTFASSPTTGTLKDRAD